MFMLVVTILTSFASKLRTENKNTSRETENQTYKHSENKSAECRYITTVVAEWIAGVWHITVVSERFLAILLGRFQLQFGGFSEHGHFPEAMGQEHREA